MLLVGEDYDLTNLAAQTGSDIVQHIGRHGYVLRLFRNISGVIAYHALPRAIVTVVLHDTGILL